MEQKFPGRKYVLSYFGCLATSPPRLSPEAQATIPILTEAAGTDNGHVPARRRRRGWGLQLPVSAVCGWIYCRRCGLLKFFFFYKQKRT
jgi:hypothetical protein